MTAKVERRKNAREKRRRGPRNNPPRAVPYAAASVVHAVPPGMLDRRAVFGLAMLSFVLSVPLFAPWSWWPLAYVCFVPWLAAVALAQRRGWMCLASFALGAVFFWWHLRWMLTTTPPGYALGAVYLAFAFPVAAWVLRHLYDRRGLGLTITFPVVWVGVELLRSRGLLAFPWFLLGHSQIRLPTVIQIADLASAFGVTFIIAMVNGWLADRVIRRRLAKTPGPQPVLRGQGVAATVVVVLLVAGTIGYGWYRLGTAELTAGPRLAVIQGDFLLTPTYSDDLELDKQETYLGLARRAAAETPRPDMVVLPETPWSLCLNREVREREVDDEDAMAFIQQSRDAHDAFVELAREHGTHVVVGAVSYESQPAGSYPATHRYNSAFVYSPDEPEPGRYDKIHLVPFGEYVPFRYSKRLFWLYRLLNDGPWNPWGRGGIEYSLTPGDDPTRFELPAASDGKPYHFGITICYEDVMPQVFRGFATDEKGGKGVDFMLNISNDGWFGHGPQQPQHLVNCAFRAVENRVGIARAVNTGVSGFIDPTGAWHDLVVEPARGPHAGGTGYRVARVHVDPRVTVYSRYGDVFAWGCTILALAGLGDALIGRIRSRRAAKTR